MTTCPRCSNAFAGSVCPECGAEVVRRVSGTLRTSAVLISSGHETGFYRSLQDVPESLREKLLEATGGENAGTIVIADQAGKEQLTQVVARRSSAFGFSGALAAAQAHRTPPPRPRHSLFGLSWVVWAGVALAAASVALIAAVFLIR